MNGGGERWTAVGGRNREQGADGGPGWKESRESEHRRAGGGHRRQDAGQRSAETKTHGPSWEMGTERDGVKEAENSMGPERREPGTEGPTWADGSRKEEGPGESGVGGEQEAGASPGLGVRRQQGCAPRPTDLPAAATAAAQPWPSGDPRLLLPPQPHLVHLRGHHPQAGEPCAPASPPAALSEALLPWPGLSAPVRGSVFLAPCPPLPWVSTALFLPVCSVA